MNNIIDMNTAEGCAKWMADLPTENLQSIAARPLDPMNTLIVVTAGLELQKRGIIAIRNLSQGW